MNQKIENTMDKMKEAQAKMLLSRLAERGETFQWAKCPRHLMEAVKVELMRGMAIRMGHLQREIGRIEDSYRNECSRRRTRRGK